MFKFINLLLFYFFTITGLITFGLITVFAICFPYLNLIAAAGATAVAACGVIVMYILMVPVSSTRSQSQITLQESFSVHAVLLLLLILMLVLVLVLILMAYRPIHYTCKKHKPGQQGDSNQISCA